MQDKSNSALINWVGYLAITLLVILPLSVLTVRSGAWQQGLLLYALACLGSVLLLALSLLLMLLPKYASQRQAIRKRALFTLPGETPAQEAPMIRHTVLRVIAKLLIPYILLFALYVQYHGDYGPGGGFQAGVIFGAAIILYTLMFGLDAARRVFRPRVLEFLVAFGLLLFGGVGIVAIFEGGNFLDYDVLSHEPIHGQHLGILLVELGVGITVAAVMATIFFLFAGRGRSDV